MPDAGVLLLPVYGAAEDCDEAKPLGVAPDEGNGGNWDEALRASADVSLGPVFALRHQSHRGMPMPLWQPVIINRKNATIET